MLDPETLLRALGEGDVGHARDELLAAWRETRSPMLARALNSLRPRLLADVDLDRSLAGFHDYLWGRRCRQDNPADHELLFAAVDQRCVELDLKALKAMKRRRPDPRLAWTLLPLLNRWLPLEREEPRVAPTIHILAKHRGCGAIEAVNRAAASAVHQAALDQLPTEAAVESVAIDEAALIAALAQWTSPSYDSEPLLGAVFESPECDVARAVLADRLSGRGIPWGEFITLQLWPEQDAQTRDRQAELSAAGRFVWTGPLHEAIAQVEFERGFPVSACVLNGRSAAHVAATGSPHWRTFERLHVETFAEALKRMQRPDWNYSSRLPPEVRALVADPVLRDLQTLEGVDWETVAMLAAGPPRALRRLHIGTHEGGLWSSDLQGALAHGNALAQLEELEFEAAWAPDVGPWLTPLLAGLRKIRVACAIELFEAWRRALSPMTQASITRTDAG